MSMQAIPVGVNLNSPVAWLVIAVAAIVFALTLSTRRTTMRPRETVSVPPQPQGRGQRERYAGDWSAAQALFVENPRAGCDQARAILAAALHERDTTGGSAGRAEASYAAALAVMQRGDASTDDLRAAFTSLRSAFEALSSDVTPSPARAAGRPRPPA